MFTYYCIYVSILLSKLSSYLFPKKIRNRWVVFAVFAYLILIFSLRHESMGIDLQYMNREGYLGSFEQISEMQWGRVILEPFKNYEVGYRILNKIIGSVFIERQLLLTVCALLSLAPIGFLLARESKSPCLAIIIYLSSSVFSVIFSALRQGIAVALCNLSIIYIIEKKWKHFLFWVIAASLFHKSALLFLIAYPIFHLRFRSFLWKLLSLAVLPLILSLRSYLFPVFALILKKNALVDNNGAYNLMLIYIIVYVFCLIFARRDDVYNGFVNLFYIAVVGMIFSGVYSTAVRVVYYFMISMSFVVPMAINSIKSKYFRLPVCIFIALIFIYSALILLRYHTSFTFSYPYYFFWEK